MKKPQTEEWKSTVWVEERVVVVPAARLLIRRGRCADVAVVYRANASVTRDVVDRHVIVFGFLSYKFII